MSQYTIYDKETKKEITFDWHDEKNPPTQQDMLNVVAKAKDQQTQPEKSKELSWQETLKNEAPVMVPSIVGGIIGSRFGTKGAVTGAGIGAAFGKTADTAVKKMLGLPGGEKTKTEIATEALKVGGREAGYELFPRAVIGTGKKIFAPASKTIIPETKRLAGLVKKEFQPVLTIAEQTKGWVQDIIQTFVKKGLTSGKTWQEFVEKRGNVIKNLADDYVSNFGGATGREEMGVSVVDKYLANKKVISESFKELYDKLIPQLEKTKTKIVTEMVPSLSGIVDASGKPIMTAVKKEVEENIGAKIDLRPLKIFAKSRLKSLQAAGKMEPELSGANILNDIFKQDDFVNYSNAKELRTTLREMGESFDISGKKGRVVGLAQNLGKITDKQIGEGLQKYNPELAKQWRGINSAYKASMEKYDSDIIRSLIKQGLPESRGGYNKPERVAMALMRQNNMSQIKAFVRMAGGIDSPVVKNVKSAFADQLVKRAIKTTDQGSMLQGTKFIDNLNKYGEETLDILFKPEQKAMLYDVGKLAKISQETYGNLAGNILIPMLQTGAITGMGFSLAYQKWGSLAISSAVLAMPNILERAITNKNIVNYFTRARQFNPNTPTYAAIMTKLSAALYRIYESEQKKKTN